jgi:hypothetical protein
MNCGLCLDLHKPDARLLKVWVDRQNVWKANAKGYLLNTAILPHIKVSIMIVSCFSQAQTKNHLTSYRSKNGKPGCIYARVA